jgi:hypothetical protein
MNWIRVQSAIVTSDLSHQILYLPRQIYDGACSSSRSFVLGRVPDSLTDLSPRPSKFSPRYLIVQSLAVLVDLGPIPGPDAVHGHERDDDDLDHLECQREEWSLVLLLLLLAPLMLLPHCYS